MSARNYLAVLTTLITIEQNNFGFITARIVRLVWVTQVTLDAAAAQSISNEEGACYFQTICVQKVWLKFKRNLTRYLGLSVAVANSRTCYSGMNCKTIFSIDCTAKAKTFSTEFSWRIEMQFKCWNRMASGKLKLFSYHTLSFKLAVRWSILQSFVPLPIKRSDSFCCTLPISFAK